MLKNKLRCHYLCVSQYSGMFYFYHLNIHVSQYSGMFYFYQLNIHMSQYSDVFYFIS